MFSAKRNNPFEPKISPRRVIAPKQFSKYIQQSHTIQIQQTAESSLSTSSTKSVSCPLKSTIPSSPTVATMDILYPEQRKIVSKLAMPKSRPSTSPKNSPNSVQSKGTLSEKKPIRRKSSSSLGISTKSRTRESVEELEKELIEQTKILHKLTVEAEQVSLSTQLYDLSGLLTIFHRAHGFILRLGSN